MSLTTKSPIRNNIFKQLMTIHWWMALLYLVLFATGIPLEKVQKSITLHDILITTHKSFGILVLILLIWRLLLLVRVWGRKYLKHLPQFTRRWYFKTGLHTFLYLMMLVVPLSGYWLSNAFQAHNTSMFGLLTMQYPMRLPLTASPRKFFNSSFSFTRSLSIKLLKLIGTG
jgi:cytochrome b561